jgi:hypothetical protein
MFFVAAGAQTYHCRVVKLRFLSSYFEYQDLFFGQQNRLSERELLIAEGDE